MIYQLPVEDDTGDLNLMENRKKEGNYSWKVGCVVWIPLGALGSRQSDPLHP